MSVWAIVISAIGCAALFGLVIATYAVVSFALMRPHATARTFAVSLRALAREWFFVAMTQPFLPLYYLFGRRMGRRRATYATPVPVVFVHGYMQNRIGFVGLARSLDAREIGPLYGFNYPWFASMASNSARLERFVAKLCAETKSASVDLVCHSMGGLVAMEMIREDAMRGRPRVRRCVTIATPHAGVMWQGPLFGVGATGLRRGSKLLEAQAGIALALPTLSIFSDHDNVVFPSATASLKERGGEDLEVKGLSHLAILFAPEVAEHVAHFLQAPAAAAAPAAAVPVFADAATNRAPIRAAARQAELGE